MKELCGVINIYKEKGFTSHDVVNIIRKSLGKIKTGHTGTLDPEAEGVLPICIGKATKISEYIASDIKEYTTELTLGIKTKTYDHTGDVIENKIVTSTKEEIERAILSFKGEYFQTPPMYSALKVNGKKLYELAREGKEIERKKRKITIYNINDISFLDNNKIKFTVLCSKGTYIRSLCDDIGNTLGCGGHMSKLTRTQTGNFFIKDSIRLNDFKKIVQDNNINSILMSVEDVMSNLKKVRINEKANKFLYNGNKIGLDYIEDKNIITHEQILVYDFENTLIGIYTCYDDFIKPVTMLI